MEDKLIMSKKELQRKTLLEGFICGKLTLQEAAMRLGISYRQIKRVWKRYKEEKDKGLQHRSRGRRPSNVYPKLFKRKVLALYQEKYLEFGPTFAAEKLVEDDGVKVHPETLRLWLKGEGLWLRKRKRKVHRERRERRPHFGDLLQIDGSIHPWFAGSEEKSCLLDMVDDATGITMALLDKGETTKILLTTFKKWIEKYGVPKAVYVDLKGVYVSPKSMKEKYDDDLLFEDGFSVFEQVCKQLNVEIIKAHSAQAKGRVERKHAVFQDRFVKDLKLYGIQTIAEANGHLESKFLNNINNKFAKTSPAIKDAHRDPASYGDLDNIICWNYLRQVKNDWTIQFRRAYYQLSDNTAVKPGVKILIKKHLDGRMVFWHEGKELAYRQLASKPEPPSRFKKYYTVKGGYNSHLLSKNSKKSKLKSPWSKFNPYWLNKPRVSKKNRKLNQTLSKAVGT
jgi:transposase